LIESGEQRMLRVLKWGCLGLLTALTLLACSNKGRLAPVEDRTLGAPQKTAKALPGAENAGKAGFYTVRQGDTLLRIGLDHGQSARDLARWNNLDNPNLIETGQVLRVSPPAQEAAAARPAGPAVTAGPAAAAQAASAASAPTAAKPVAAAPSTPANTEGDDPIAFQWPVRGPLIAGFDEAKNKGLDIAGKAGDPVLAAADGKVVYAGSGLRGYGNLIILKHNNTYLTAYAHNQTLLVKEEQTIKRGQKIAEMGNSDADQVKLHFEIRRQGKPVDPAKYLPAN
jgi:lipoprotein NlpD